MSDLENDGERTVCFCHNVLAKTLLEAMRAGAVTLEQIQAETCASTGCGGCEWEVRELLERYNEELARKKSQG